MEASLLGGSSKVRKRVFWTPTPEGVLKFNVDEAARGKPRPAGIGRVLRNSEGWCWLFSLELWGVWNGVI